MSLTFLKPESPLETEFRLVVGFRLGLLDPIGLPSLYGLSQGLRAERPLQMLQALRYMIVPQPVRWNRAS